VQLQKIGIINTPYTTLEEMPIQPKGAQELIASLTINKEYTQGLKDLDGFSHIYLIYYFHKAKRSELEVIPFMDTHSHGVFSTRSPLRPSHIGMSLTQLVSVDDNIVTIRGIDVLDGTPLLDIKPYIPQFESTDDVQTGWMNKKASQVSDARSDKRFV